jgi:hypothetical protein
MGMADRWADQGETGMVIHHAHARNAPYVNVTYDRIKMLRLNKERLGALPPAPLPLPGVGVTPLARDLQDLPHQGTLGSLKPAPRCPTLKLR